MQVIDASRLLAMVARLVRNDVNNRRFRRKHTKIGLTNGSNDLTSGKPSKTRKMAASRKVSKPLIPLVNSKKTNKKQNATTVKTSK